MVLGVTIGYLIHERDCRLEKGIIGQNRPYMAQIRELNEDTIPDLLVYSKGGESILIGQGNGKFLSIDDVLEAKKDSIKSIRK